MRQLRGVGLLLITALIWGLGFAAQSSAADSIGSFSFTAARSLVAATFLSVLLGVRRIRPSAGTPSAGACCAAGCSAAARCSSHPICSSSGSPLIRRRLLRPAARAS